MDQERHEDAAWDAVIDQAQKCSTPAELREMAQQCLWKVQQQQVLLRTAVLAFYNGGEVPRPAAGQPYPTAERAVADRKSDWHPQPDGNYVPSNVATLARELDQALKLGEVHIHGLTALVNLTDAQAQQAASPSPL